MALVQFPADRRTADVRRYAVALQRLHGEDANRFWRTEIASLAADGIDVEIVGVLDRETNRTRIAGRPVMRDIADIGADDALVITDGRRPQEVYEALSAALGQERIHAPAFLRISPPRPDAGGAAR